MSATSTGRYPAEPFLARLAAAGSDLGRQLEGSLDTPLRDYLGTLLPPGPAAGRGNPHRLRFAATVTRWLRQRAVPDPEAVGDHLLHVPVMEAASHSNLLLDVETFLNTYLFHVAHREAGHRLMVVTQCSTVSCMSRRAPASGPLFLRTRGSLYQVFPFSKRQLKDSSFCALPGPLTMRLDLLQGPGPRASEDPVLRRLAGRTWHDAAEAYRVCNAEIWSQLPLPGSLRRVALDESAAADCVAEHLLDPASPVRHLVFDPVVRAAFLAVKRELVADRGNLAVNRAAPDHFWVRRGTRLQPVLVHEEAGGTALLREAGGRAVPVPFEPEAVAAALRSGLLQADRVLAYLVRCILPGIVAVGGTSQQDYVRLYVRMLLETHRRVPFLDAADAATAAAPGLSRLGGMPLVDMTGPAAQALSTLSPRSDLCAFERSVLDEPLGRTIGSLPSARYLERALDRYEGKGRSRGERREDKEADE
ncbi:hypothetical protein [Streptomyces sp. NPDC127112]|uniref:hypothetical protein n=1 Tax=Streptomyces sp. NPDC127112 TaxID=3345364 RepID=UPI00363AB649